MSFLPTEIAKINDNTPRGYFHTLAATKKELSFWTKNVAKLNEKIEQISEKIRANPINAPHPDHHDWTPTHVAVIAGNLGAVRFFASRMANFTVRDGWAKSAQDYAVILGLNECLDVLSHKPMSAQYRGVETLEPSKAKSSDDFEKKLDRILVANPKRVKEYHLIAAKDAKRQVTHIIENLRSIAQIEGFTLIHSVFLISVRDFFFHGRSGIIKSVPKGNGFEDTLTRCRSYELYSGKCPQIYMHHRYLQLECGHTFNNAGTADAEFEENFKQVKLESPLYLEKGNVFQVTNASGIPSLLIGEDLHAIMHLHGRKNGVFKESSLALEEKIDQEMKAKEIDLKELTQLAEEMYSLGCLTTDSATGTVAQEDRYALELDIFANPLKNNETWAEKAAQKGFLKPFGLSEKDVLSFRRAITRFKVEKQCIRILLGKTFGVEQERIHFIQKVLVHLDNYIMPGPAGSLFVIDYAESMAMLDRMTERLTKEDLGKVKEYKLAMTKVLKPVLPMMARLNEQLVNAGFRVIPTPGFFANGRRVHSFFNAITGYGKKGPLIITYGITEGANFGKVLMDLYSEFIAAKIPEMTIYFVGRNTFNPTDFSDTQNWSNEATGVHCMTFEL
jgi:hypothetical protein